MAKITAVIDIGSNSARMTIFERTSRHGFHLIYEVKSKVRISENCYENGGALQEAPMKRAISALKEFVIIAKNHRARKLLCVATSAIRDASNKAEFLRMVKKECGISVRVIDGQTEARFGGVACANLSHQKDGISIDIGGGSTELALIESGKITAVESLNIGTIRLKELFFDKNDLKGAQEFVRAALLELPKTYKHDSIFGVGGSARALAKMLMKSQDYAFGEVHGYRMDVKKHIKFFEKIYSANTRELPSFGVPSDRLDNIQSGALILSELLKFLDAKEIVTSGVGVREGVFLSDFLRSSGGFFPRGVNPSLLNVADRFLSDKIYAAHLKKEALALFELLTPLHKCDSNLAHHLAVAAYLSQVGRSVNFYDANTHGAYLLLNSLDYGFSHADRAIICLLVEFSGKKISPEKNKFLLDIAGVPTKSLQWLCFILGVAQSACLARRKKGGKIAYALDKKTLKIRGDFSFYLANENINRLSKLVDFEIIFENL